MTDLSGYFMNMSMSEAMPPPVSYQPAASTYWNQPPVYYSPPAQRYGVQLPATPPYGPGAAYAAGGYAAAPTTAELYGPAAAATPHLVYGAAPTAAAQPSGPYVYAAPPPTAAYPHHQQPVTYPPPAAAAPYAVQTYAAAPYDKHRATPIQRNGE